MPTGQALAERLGLPALTAAELEAAAASTRQAKVLRDSGFLQRTPLWYYLLAEARHHGGQRLGPVGSTLVAEVLVGLVRRSEDSILRSPGWMPSLPAAKPGRFDLADLLRFAKVVGGGAAPRTYKVKRATPCPASPPGSSAGRTGGRRSSSSTGPRSATATGSAPARSSPCPGPRRSSRGRSSTRSRRATPCRGSPRKKLGDANRWPEIARLNRDIVPDPDEIVPGQVLVILKR